MADNKNYFLGLDVGTDSVGYAVTDNSYNLLKYHGEPMWGVHLFDEASLAESRRAKRTARRLLDRKQQRVNMVSEIFAQEICKIDPYFFIRRKESALFEEDSSHGVKLFDGGISDKEYHKKYPTIHHLIVELMQSDIPHDVRLVFLACSWLVANRGHFLMDVSSGKVGDFSEPYRAFCEYLSQDCDCDLPWSSSIHADTIQKIMQSNSGVTKKKQMFIEKVFDGKKPSKQADESFPYSREALVTLLSGGKAAVKDLFFNEEYAELGSISLGMDEDNFERIISGVGDDAGLLRVLRGMYDCALLNTTLNGKECISKSKIEVYEQHKEDLKWLKYFVRKYKKNEYNRIFRMAEPDNYVAFSYNTKNCPEAKKVKKATKESFSEYLSKELKNLQVEEVDVAAYEDMKTRLSQQKFLPKQVDTDNRVIPQQLYRYELEELLNHCERYLPLLKTKDKNGVSNKDKILAIFDFRIPYYVGPLNPASPFAWLKREPGKIYPWNFSEMVDLDESERRFISRMTNTCTYLPGEGVLPQNSLLYQRFMVLNEINTLKINGNSIPTSVKKEIFNDLYVNNSKKVSLKTIQDYLKSKGLIQVSDEISGMDIDGKASLKSLHSFKRLLDNSVLTEKETEDIINHAAYAEDKSRMLRWLTANYPNLSQEDCRYILHLNLKGFGRLSSKFLSGILGSSKETGEAFTIMEALWETNDNLMQLLEDRHRYSFREEVDAFINEYYSDPKNKTTLSERLSDMYISNAVKRPIIRTLDVISDIEKAMGGSPSKIFVEMARGGSEEQKGKRTLSRKQQLLNLYKTIKDDDIPALTKELEAMGDTADNKLQSDRLFLYYLQLGRCMYTNEPIDLNQLSSKTYDIDHIYPQSLVKDDSILNNKVLVLSVVNGTKGDRYPVEESVRKSMIGFWTLLKNNKLITDEKFKRLTRTTGFTEEEKHQFINRQLVETRQSTKALGSLLKERFPKAEIVYAKAGMVSEYRQEFDLIKSRYVNDLHHAKDAYLNIVVGNVYHEKFTRRWFDTSKKYNISVNKIFSKEQVLNGESVWCGEEDIARIRKIVLKNNIHVSQYQFCRHSGQSGGFFNQNPQKAAEGLIPLKTGLKTEKYGGYSGSTSTFFVLTGFLSGKKKELMFFPMDLLYSERFMADDSFATEYIKKMLIENGKKVDDVYFPLGKRILKINTLLSLDGFLVCLSSGSFKDGRVGFLPLTQFTCDYKTERYIKRLERLNEKRKNNVKYVVSEEFDGVSCEENIRLYDFYMDKAQNTVFCKRPGISPDWFVKNRDCFINLSLEEQSGLLYKVHMLFTRQPNPVDLLGKLVMRARKSMFLSGWKADYSEVHIVDQSASGLFARSSGNLLELL